jgi:hypothetical protein
MDQKKGAVKEMWYPRCLKCGNGNLLLAPMTNATHDALAYIEVYCAECQWQGRLDENLKKIYVRL